MATNKEKFNKKHGQPKDASNSLAKIAKLSGIKKSALQKIYNKGIGAYKTNPGSVRPNVKSKEQWAMARVYSSVMGGKAAKVDAKELKEGRKK
jgi:alkyl sulfatase BDS1-like metallo-beta-lactamase superfamily hydrolase